MNTGSKRRSNTFTKTHRPTLGEKKRRRLEQKNFILALERASPSGINHPLPIPLRSGRLPIPGPLFAPTLEPQEFFLRFREIRFKRFRKRTIEITGPWNGLSLYRGQTVRPPSSIRSPLSGPFFIFNPNTPCGMRGRVDAGFPTGGERP